MNKKSKKNRHKTNSDKKIKRKTDEKTVFGERFGFFQKSFLPKKLKKRQKRPIRNNAQKRA
jgi:hypothetical protein